MSKIDLMILVWVIAASATAVVSTVTTWIACRTLIEVLRESRKKATE